MRPCVVLYQPRPPTRVVHLSPSGFPVCSGRAFLICCLLGITRLSTWVQPLIAFVLMDCLPVCTSVGGSSLYTPGACARTAQVHTHLLLSDRGILEAWDSHCLTSCRLSQVLRQCMGLQLPGFRHLLICLSHLLYSS